jgi:hypothetical protein
MINLRPLDLVVPGFDFLAFGGFDSNFFKVESVGCGSSAHCHQNSIEFFSLFKLFCLLVLYNHFQTSGFCLLYAFRKRSVNNIYLSFDEIVEYKSNHIAVEPSEVLSSGHQVHFIAHSFQKSSHFNANVASSNNHRFPGRGLLLENIVAGDSMLSSFNVQVAGSSAGGDEEVFGFYFVVLRIFMVKLWKITGLEIVMDHLWMTRADKCL